jgi:hypothetical protein
MINRLCEHCQERRAEHKHHLFSQTKKNRELYPEYIDSELNIMYLCHVCHLNKSILKYNEKEFCEMLGIKPRSKSSKEDI